MAWSPKALISVDLAKNVSAVRAGTIAASDIQVDDHRIDGGLTSIGPRFPGGVGIGEIWLSESFYNGLGNKPPRQPASAPDQAFDYESTSILYWSGPLAGRRYLGFHAKIVGTNGPLTRMEIWHGGTARGRGRPAGAWWLDLDQVAHPVDPVATQISPTGPQEGPLFLDAQTARGMTVYSTKRPPGNGHSKP